MVTWYLDDGTLIDVFVFNFGSHVVSDVAPDTTPPGSLGTVKILDRASPPHRSVNRPAPSAPGRAIRSAASSTVEHAQGGPL